jgi:hypothetical protein
MRQYCEQCEERWDMKLIEAFKACAQVHDQIQLVETQSIKNFQDLWISFGLSQNAFPGSAVMATSLLT